MDKESLYLSEQVLGANPDFSTLWNFRREIFLHMKDEKYVLNICFPLTRFSLFVDINASLTPIIIIIETSIKHHIFVLLDNFNSRQYSTMYVHVGLLFLNLIVLKTFFPH